MSPEIQIVLGIITLIGVISGAVVTGRYAERKTKLENEAAPYESVVKRVTYLEDKDLERDKQMEALRKEYQEIKWHLELDREYIRNAVPWIEHHKKHACFPPPEPPDWWVNT